MRSVSEWPTANRAGGVGETPVGLKAASFRFAHTPEEQKTNREF
jgi:hypothetical protein